MSSAFICAIAFCKTRWYTQLRRVHSWNLMWLWLWIGTGKKWWCCWRECEEGEEACWLFVNLWIERRYIEEWDVEKCYEGYFEVKYITHWHLECASARHPVALETYICYWSIARLLWYVRPTVSARDSGVQEMCSSSGVTICRHLKCASTITK